MSVSSVQLTRLRVGVDRIGLVAFRKTFVPPTIETPVIVRSIDYAGEEHPATAKRVVVVPVDQLPLRDEDAVHKLKLLAGPRWTPNPPADAGVSGLGLWGDGYIKISCEDFPKPAQNLKWASDTLDRLVAEANVSSDRFFCVLSFVDHGVSLPRATNSATYRWTCAMYMQRHER